MDCLIFVATSIGDRDQLPTASEIDQPVDVIIGGRFREIKIGYDLWWRHWAPVTDVDADASESRLVEEFHECFEARCILGEELRPERLLVQEVSRWRMGERSAPVWAK